MASLLGQTVLIGGSGHRGDAYPIRTGPQTSRNDRCGAQDANFSCHNPAENTGSSEHRKEIGLFVNRNRRATTSSAKTERRSHPASTA